MNLQEKIFHCRKKKGLSQEELGELLGVSRQAVSKWETGEAVPETNKLPILADVFEVTVDWLLRENWSEEEYELESPQGNWVDSIPDVIGRLFKSYGWLVGLYIALFGLAATAMGALARSISRSISGGFSGSRGVFFDNMGRPMADPFSGIPTNDPVSILGGFMMSVGIIALIGGIVLALLLKRQGKE